MTRRVCKRLNKINLNTSSSSSFVVLSESSIPLHPPASALKLSLNLFRGRLTLLLTVGDLS